MEDIEYSWVASIREDWLDQEPKTVICKQMKELWLKKANLEGEEIEKLVKIVTDNITNNIDRGTLDRNKIFSNKIVKGKINWKRKNYANIQELFKKCPS